MIASGRGFLIHSVADIERYVVEAGFEGFSSYACGSIVVFGVIEIHDETSQSTEALMDRRAIESKERMTGGQFDDEEL